MDTQRLLLFIGLSFVLLLIWEQWQKANQPPPAPASTPAAMVGEQPPSAPGETASVPVPGDNASVPAVASPIADSPLLQSGQSIQVETDVMSIRLDTRGGDLREVYLKDYPVSVDKPEEPFRLMDDKLPNLFIAHSGLRGSPGKDESEKRLDHSNAVYTVPKTDYTLGAGNNVLKVVMTRALENGLSVIKTYTFTRSSHLIHVDHELRNNSDQPWRGSQYRLLERTQVAEGTATQFVYTYMGAVIYSPEEKYEKVDFADIKEGELRQGRSVTDGWIAMIQHYFLGAWIPNPGESDLFYSRYIPDNVRYQIGMVSTPTVEVQPGQTAVFTSRLYVGPKVQSVLEDIAPGLELTADYGSLTFIAKPLFWLLDQIHNIVQNWGVAIILVTLLIKLAFYKLSETSYRSMANMRKLQPRLQSLKERYGDDKQRLNQAMMDLYKTEKINPLGGCLPILVQIPVFIALYWVLLESVELRQAPFFLWINDLSTPDPYFVLPLIMGVTMFIQQKLNPAPLDPLQAKVMMILPVVFTVFFAFFPSGLVLYWVVNNTLSIAQQWVITKRIEGGAKA